MQRESLMAVCGGCAVFCLWMAGVLLTPPIRTAPGPRESIVVALARPPRCLSLLPLRIVCNLGQIRPVHRVIAAYPSEPGVRVTGTVRIGVVIGTDGRIRELRVLSGHPLLIPAALEAVKQWVFAPTLLNGEAVEVESEFDVVFHPK